MRRTSPKMQGKRIMGSATGDRSPGGSARRYTPAEIRRDRLWLTTSEFEAKHGRRPHVLEPVGV